MSETSRLGLPLLAAAQAQKHVTHNEALLTLDALAQPVAQALVNAPPSPAQEGMCWLVGSSPAGAFAGQSGRIALRRDGTWHFISAGNGWRMFVAASGCEHIFDAARSAWRPALVVSAFGSATFLSIEEEELTLSGVSVSSNTAMIRARDIVLGVSCLVTQSISGVTGFSAGTAGDVSRFGSLLAVSAGSTNAGVVGPVPFYAPTPVVITASGGSFTGGALRLSIHALRIDVAQS